MAPTTIVVVVEILEAAACQRHHSQKAKIGLIKRGQRKLRKIARNDWKMPTKTMSKRPIQNFTASNFLDDK